MSGDEKMNWKHIFFMLGCLFLFGLLMLGNNTNMMLILSVAFFIGFGIESYIESWARKNNLSGDLPDMIIEADAREVDKSKRKQGKKNGKKKRK